MHHHTHAQRPPQPIPPSFCKPTVIRNFCTISFIFFPHSPSTTDGDKDACCWFCCWLSVLSCCSAATVLSILSPAPSLSPSSTSAVPPLFTEASPSAAPVAACMAMFTNPSRWDEKTAPHGSLRLLREKGKPSAHVMDEEEEHDHGICTLRAHIRDWVVTPEAREPPHRAGSIMPRTCTAAKALNVERSTTF